VTLAVLPATPELKPFPVTFNSIDAATIICESRNGKPAAQISLTATTRLLNERTASISSIDFVSLELPLPLTDWHNATAKCCVTNHNFTNSNATAINRMLPLPI